MAARYGSGNTWPALVTLDRHAGTGATRTAEGDRLMNGWEQIIHRVPPGIWAARPQYLVAASAPGARQAQPVGPRTISYSDRLEFWYVVLSDPSCTVSKW